MVERLGEALLELGTDDRKLKRGLSGAEKRTRATIVTIQKVFATLVTVALVRAVTRSFDTVITKLDAIAKTADKLGLTTEALQEMRFAAERSGVAVQTFDMAFQRFTRRAGEAAKGTGEAKNALKELGFTLDDLRTKSPEELFQQAALALANVETEAQRLVLAFKLFDSEGVAIVNMVANLAALRQEARDLGIVLADDLVRDAVKMKDQLTDAFAVIDAAWARFVINFVKGLDVIFGVFPDTLESQLGDQVEELRTLQNRLAAIAGEVARGGPSPQLEIDRLNERQELLQKEIRTTAGLIEVRRRAADLGAGGAVAAGGAGADDPFGDILENIEDQANALELRAAAIGMNTTEMAEFIALSEAMNAANKEGLDLTTEQSDAIRQFASDVGEAAGRLEEATEKARALSDAVRDQESALRRDQAQVARLGESFLQMAANGTASFKDMVRSILADFTRMEIRMLSSRLFSGGSTGGGGIFGSLLKLGAGFLGGLGGGGAAANAGGSVTGTSTIPSFAHGGSFTVGGRGGTDRNLVAFNATRGERVRVTPAGADAGGGLTINQNIDARGAVEGTAVAIARAVAANNKQLPDLIRNAQTRGM